MPASASLPSGFQLDSPQQMASNWRAKTGITNPEVPTPFDTSLPQNIPAESAADKVSDFSSAIGSAINAGALKTKAGAEMALAGIPTALGDRSLSDAIFGKIQAEDARAQQLDREAQGQSKGGAVAGNVLSFVPMVLGGEALAPERASEAATSIGGKILGHLGHTLPTAAAIGENQAAQQGASVAESGGTGSQAEKAYLTALPAQTIVNLLPAAVPGSEAVRGISGAAIGAGGQAGAQALEHAVNPQYIPKPSLEQAEQAGGIGGLIGLATGGRGFEPPMDPYLRNYQESRPAAPPEPPAPAALPAPAEPVGAQPASAAEATQAPKPAPDPTVFAAASFKQDPRTALNALDHDTLVQVAQDAGLDVKPTDAHADIVNKAVAKGSTFLEQHMLPEYLANLPDVGNGHPAAEPPAVARASGSQAASLSPGVTVPVDASGTAYTPAQGAQSFLQGLDEARGIPRQLPNPVTTVDSAGNAVDSQAFTRALEEQRNAAQNRLDMGITPDIERTQAARWAQAENARLDAEREQMVGQREDFAPPEPQWWEAGQYADQEHQAAIAALKRDNPNAPAPLSPATPVDTSHDVPLGGGVAKDNSRIYIDKRIPQYIDVPKADGSGMARVDAWEDIAGHEAAEKPELDKGTHYYDAHEGNANSYEDGFLRSKYGVTREAFDEALKPYLAKAENSPGNDVPADLDRKPYEDGNDTALLPELSNQLAKIGIPEELHPQAAQFLSHVENALSAGVDPAELKAIAKADDDLPSKIAKINNLTREYGGHAPDNAQAESVPRKTATGSLHEAGEAGNAPAQQGSSQADRAEAPSRLQQTLSDRPDELAQPFNLTREEFLGNPKITKDSNARDLKPKALSTVKDKPAEPFLGKYQARYSEDGAAVYDGTKVIASYNFGDTLTVSKPYRNEGIGHELVYQWRKRYPAPAVAKERTKASQAIQEKVWNRIQSERKSVSESSDTSGVPLKFRRADWKPQVEGRAITEIDSLVKRYGGSTLADSIANDLREHSTAQLIGQTISSPEDLATLASVYRNPAFETMRYVYVDGAGNVLGETAVSSRMPSTTLAFPTGRDDGAAWIKENAPEGATGVWLMHNHPSGNPKASSGDIAVTQSLSIRLGDMAGAPKLKGHVILDHDTFGYLDDLGEDKGIQKIQGAPDIDMTRYGRGDFEMFGQKVTDPSFAAVTGKRIAAATPEDSSAIVVMDAQGRVASVHTFPNDFLATPRGAAMLSRLGQKRGAAGIGLVTTRDNFIQNRDVFNKASQRGIFRDAFVVAPDGTGISLNDTKLFPRENRKNYGQQSAAAQKRSHAGVRAFENAPGTEEPIISLTTVRQTLRDRGVPQEKIDAMSRDELRAEQANMRRRSPAPKEEIDNGTATGIKDATVTEERAMKGKAAVEHDLSRSNPEAFRTAKKQLESDPQYGVKLAADLIQKPRPHTQEEAMALALDRMRIINDRRSAYDQLQESLKSGDTMRSAAADARIRILDSQMENNDKAAEMSGHETGAALQARRTMVKDDYTMAAMVAKAKQAKGSDLTPAERSAWEQRALAIEKRVKALEERDAQNQNARREPRSPKQRAEAKSKFDSLAEKLKGIAQKDQMKPGCAI